MFCSSKSGDLCLKNYISYSKLKKVLVYKVKKSNLRSKLQHIWYLKIKGLNLKKNVYFYECDNIRDQTKWVLKQSKIQKLKKFNEWLEIAGKEIKTNKTKKKRRIWKLQHLSHSTLGDTKTKQSYNLVDETCGGWILPVRDGRELVKYCDMISLLCFVITVKKSFGLHTKWMRREPVLSFLVLQSIQ